MALLKDNRLNRRTFGAIAAAGLLSRCATVPDIDGLTPGDVGLAARGTKLNTEVIDDTDALQQQYDLQRALSASPIVFGNQVTLLSSGTEAFQAIFTAIAGARDSINLEYFILADVQSDGVHLSDLLLDKLRAGVKVNMIYDAYGSRDTPGTFFEAMRTGRGQGRGVQSAQPPRGESWLVTERPRPSQDRRHRRPDWLHRRHQPGHGLREPSQRRYPGRRQHAQRLLARHRGADRGTGGG